MTGAPLGWSYMAGFAPDSGEEGENVLRGVFFPDLSEFWFEVVL